MGETVPVGCGAKAKRKTQRHWFRLFLGTKCCAPTPRLLQGDDGAEMDRASHHCICDIKVSPWRSGLEMRRERGVFQMMIWRGTTSSGTTRRSLLCSNFNTRDQLGIGSKWPQITTLALALTRLAVQFSLSENQNCESRCSRYQCFPLDFWIVHRSTWNFRRTWSIRFLRPSPSYAPTAGLLLTSRKKSP